MNLIVDIGNTITKLAIFDNGELLEISYTDNDTLSGLSGFVKRFNIRRSIVSTVVDLSDKACEVLDSMSFPVMMIDGNTRFPVDNLYETPETLGNDRIAAVVGASSLFPGRNILVIDAGTCITYDLVDSMGRYIGGNISLGLLMRFKALNMFTSRLPLIEKNGRMTEIGKNTETAIRMGVIKGVEYEVSGYISSLSEKYDKLLIFLTGGDNFPFDISPKNEIFADKFLVLKGLNRILEYNDSI